MSPPKLSRSMVSPTSGTFDLGFSLAVSVAFVEDAALAFGAGLLFFSTTGGGAGALRLRSSTIVGCDANGVDENESIRKRQRG